MYDFKERYIIPRYKLTTDQMAKSIVSYSSSVAPYLNDYIRQYETSLSNYQNSKSFVNALELISSCRMLNKFPQQYTDALKWLKGRISPTLLNLHMLDNQSQVNLDVFSCIKALKQKIVTNPDNVYAWLDLAYYYMYLNQLEKAKYCIQVALASKYVNNVVLRSAVRFFVHYERNQRLMNRDENLDKLWKRVRHSAYLVDDPWLVSLDVSLSHFLDKEQKNIKRGFRIIQDNNFHNSDLTELIGALATYISQKDGDRKRSKKLLRDSHQFFNENTHAQSQFLFPFEDWDGRTIQNDYEYQTRYKISIEDFDGAFIYAQNWQKYQPFSSRPIVLGSFISSSVLGKYNDSIALIENFTEFKGVNIVSILDEPMIYNNYAFALLKLGQIEDAYVTLEALNKLHLDSDKRAVVNATLGLYYYRSGRSEKGHELYTSTIQHFSNNQDFRSSYLASIMMFVEEARLNRLQVPCVKVRKLHTDIISLNDKVINKVFDCSALSKYL